MSVRNLKPTTPGQRQKSISNFDDITTNKPEKSLLTTIKKTGGRNNKGRLTSRRRGGGHKRQYRVIDFKRNKFDIPAKIASIEYDPNRSARIALLNYVDGEKRYIIAPFGIKVGDEIISSLKNAPLKLGNTMPLSKIPAGQVVHNIEMIPGKGAQMVRSAGLGAQIVAKDLNMVTIKLPSGEIRMFSENCLATIGEIGNKSHETIKLGKAGRSRGLGKRPKGRGVAMNPVDHPMGGGEGKSSGGHHPTTPWGKPTKGYKTRKKNNPSNRYITKRRN